MINKNDLYDITFALITIRNDICEKILTLSSKIINSKSPEAKEYDFSVVDTFFVGNVEFRTRYFYCPQCLLNISFQEMKKFEKDKQKK